MLFAIIQFVILLPAPQQRCLIYEHAVFVITEMSILHQVSNFAVFTHLQFQFHYDVGYSYSLASASSQKAGFVDRSRGSTLVPSFP